MPVYSHVAIEDTVRRLGSRIREERRRRAWTLKELAGRAGVSIATLSAIETRKASLDVKLLYQLSEALSVPIDALLPRSTTSHYQITRRSAIEGRPPAPMKLVNRVHQAAMPYHNRLWPLADSYTGKHIEPFEIEIEPVRDEEMCFISHNHEEFVFVLRGEIEWLMKSPDGLLREALRPGDCIQFWSYLPHCMRSAGATPARSVHVLYSLHEIADSESADGSVGPMIYLMEAPHKDPVQEIANKIVFLRRALGMSAGEFARHLDISVRRLANIERGHRPVSLGLLLRMCHTFRKPMEYFIASTVVERPFYGIRRAKQVREGSRRSAVDADQGYGCFGDARLEALANGPPDRGMRPHLVRLSRRGARPAPLSQHAGQEFVYVLKGAVGLMTERDDGRLRETLFPGDSCFIDSSVPHRFVNARFNPYDGSGAEALAVSWSPPQGAS